MSMSEQAKAFFKVSSFVGECREVVNNGDVCGDVNWHILRGARWGRREREMRTTMSRSSRLHGNGKCRGMPPICNQKGSWVCGEGGFGTGCGPEKRKGKGRKGSGSFPLLVLAVLATLGTAGGQNATTSFPETTPQSDPFVPVFSFRETNLRECVTYSSNNPTVCIVFMNADAPPKIAQPNYKQMGCTQGAFGLIFTDRERFCVDMCAIPTLQ